MANTPPAGPSTNSRPVNGDLNDLAGLGKSEQHTDRRFVPAFLVSWVCSGVIHGILLVLFLFVTVNKGSTSVMEREVIQTQVDDEGPRQENLTNDDIGNDPDKLLDYKNDHIDQVSVPGPSLPDEPVGMKNAPESEPMNVPPPPGFGGGTGSG